MRGTTYSSPVFTTPLAAESCSISEVTCMPEFCSVHGPSLLANNYINNCNYQYIFNVKKPIPRRIVPQQHYIRKEIG